jgi:arylsulfatase A-like enzyme
MKLTHFILAALSFAQLHSLHATDLQPERPNIVYILSDDLGYGDPGCYNKGSKIPTPNLDRLASEGTRFTDAHAPNAVCTPTRYAILTGRYCWRTRLRRGVLGPWDKPLIAADRLTVPKLLGEHGYATACFGKWHLGFTWATKDGAPPSSNMANRLSNVDFTKAVGDGPTTRGFDYYFGVDLPNYPPYCFIENDHTVGIPSVPDAGKEEQFNRPGPMLEGWKLVNILPEVTTRAIRWIEDTAKTGKPFFVYLPLTSPHFPVVPAPEFKGKSQAGDYGDYVVETDAMVGRVLDALQRAGVAEKTLVIFTSDNGPEVVEINPGAYERIRQYQHYSMGTLRGVKRDAWEGGHRVPFFARWPGKIKAGAVSDETICHVDFMATVAAIIGAKLPENAGEDSVNVLPALLGEKAGPAREATVLQGDAGKYAIRKGDWVFIDAPNGDGNLRNGQGGEPAWFKEERGYVADNQPGELFNLHDDLPERRNQYAEHPEVVRELKGLLEKYKHDGRSTPGAPQENDTPFPPHVGPLTE